MRSGRLWGADGAPNKRSNLEPRMDRYVWVSHLRTSDTGKKCAQGNIAGQRRWREPFKLIKSDLIDIVWFLNRFHPSIPTVDKKAGRVCGIALFLDRLFGTITKPIFCYFQLNVREVVGWEGSVPPAHFFPDFQQAQQKQAIIYCSLPSQVLKRTTNGGS